MPQTAFAGPLTRRLLLSLALAIVALPGHGQTAPAPVKLGIIGTGHIGSVLAVHWVKSGHEVFVSSRHPEELQALVAQLGAHAHAGTPRQAAAFGTVVVVSVPYSAMPQLGADLRSELADKVIIDTSNPSERRDGAMALDAQKKGAGVATAEYLHNDRVVRAFNYIPAAALAEEGDRKPERVALAIGGDDAQALKIVAQLVRETGFEPVVIGSLARTREFDLGQPLAHIELTAAQLKARAGP